MITKPTIYTREFVLQQLKEILADIEANESLIYKGQLFGLGKRKYPRQCYSEWAEQFEKDKEISDAIKAIDDILESRVNVGGLTNKLNATMVIFNLKNNYGWRDQTQVDMNVNTVEDKLKNALYGTMGKEGADISGDIQDSEQEQDSSPVQAEPATSEVQPQQDQSGHNPEGEKAGV